MATTTRRSNPSASSSSRRRTALGMSPSAVSGRSTQPSRSSPPREPVVPSPPGGVRSLQGGASVEKVMHLTQLEQYFVEKINLEILLLM